MRTLKIEEMELVGGGMGWSGSETSDNVIDCRGDVCAPYTPPEICYDDRDGDE